MGWKIKNLDVNYVSLKYNTLLKETSNIFNNLVPHRINLLNWDKFQYLPSVEFRIFYTDNSIFIKFNIKENGVLATKLNTNEPVYKDSCVEFFISPNGEKYYNFEFNCIGTKYCGSGYDRASSVPIDNSIVEKIKTYSSLGTKKINYVKEDIRWYLIVEIPLMIFTNKHIDKIRNSSMRANFYKCGDDMPIPHYLSWNNIQTEHPDFHRPEFFGQINFK